MFLRWKPMNAKLRKERTHYERFLHLLTVKSLTPPNSRSLQMEAAAVPVKKILVCWILCWALHYCNIFHLCWICPEPFQFAFDCYTQPVGWTLWPHAPRFKNFEMNCFDSKCVNQMRSHGTCWSRTFSFLFNVQREQNRSEIFFFFFLIGNQRFIS